MLQEVKQKDKKAHLHKWYRTFSSPAIRLVCLVHLEYIEHTEIVSCWFLYFLLFFQTQKKFNWEDQCWWTSRATSLHWKQRPLMSLWPFRFQDQLQPDSYHRAIEVIFVPILLGGDKSSRSSSSSNSFVACYLIQLLDSKIQICH